MAYVHAHPGYDYSLEEAVQKINSARRRESITALSIGALAVLLFGTVIYLSFHDVPAPESPANANFGVGQPYR